MAVTIQNQVAITAGDTDWAAEAEANRVKANGNDTALKSAVEALQQAVPVQKVKVGATTYNPDGAGLVTLPAGVVAPATTTTERDAIASPTIGQLIYNTTNARAEMYTPSGWVGVGSAQIDVFTASGTWTKPTGARVCHVIAIGGGGGGAAGGGGAMPGGAGGERADATLAAALLPSTVSVTVGAGGGSTSIASGQSSDTGRDGGYGGNSSFGDIVVAGGGCGGLGSNRYNKWMCAGGSHGRQGRLITDQPTTANVTPWRPEQANIASASGLLASAIPLPGSGASTWLFDAGNWFNNTNNEKGRSAGLGSPRGGGAGGGGLQDTSYIAYAGGASGTAERSTGPAGSTSGNGTSGTSRTGTGRAGDGGGATAQGNPTASRTAGSGGIPGGGGGASYCDAGYTVPAGVTLTSGAGARGEVIVITTF